MYKKSEWAYSSAGEHYVDIVGVTGSIPVTPTILFNFLFFITSCIHDDGLLRFHKKGMNKVRYFICLIMLLISSTSESAEYAYRMFASLEMDQSRSTASRRLGSHIAQGAIDELQRIIFYQNFDRYLCDGSARPADQDPDFEAFDARKMPHAMKFYRSEGERKTAILRDLYLPFCKAVTAIASLTHDYPGFEVLGRLGQRDIWTGGESQAFFIELFRDTSELAYFKNVMMRLKSVAWAIENKKPVAEIKRLKDRVKICLGDDCLFPRLLDRAYATYAEEIRGELDAIVGPTTAGCSTESLAIVRALIRVGEVIKLTSNKYRRRPAVKKVVEFRDKAVKILPRRLEDFEAKAMRPHLTAAATFITQLTGWFKGGSAEPTPDAINNIRKHLGYNGKWKRGTSAVSEPDDAFLRAGAQRIKDLVDARYIKSRSWESIAFALQDALPSISGPVYALRDVLYEEAAAAAASGGGDDDVEPRPGEVVTRAWGEVLLDVTPEDGDTIGMLLDKSQAAIRGFPDRLKPIGIDAAAVERVDWKGITDFEIDPLTRIRANLFSKSVGVYYFTATNSFLMLLRDRLEKLPDDTFMTARLIGYTLTQAIVDNPETFARFNPYLGEITKIRKFWAHPRIGDDFPEIVVPYSDSTKGNEAAALAGLFFMIQDFA